jgi:hypothetical protein
VPGAGCRVPGAGCRVPGAGCRVPGALYSCQNCSALLEWVFATSHGAGFVSRTLGKGRCLNCARVCDCFFVHTPLTDGDKRGSCSSAEPHPPARCTVPGEHRRRHGRCHVPVHHLRPWLWRTQGELPGLAPSVERRLHSHGGGVPGQGQERQGSLATAEAGEGAVEGLAHQEAFFLLLLLLCPVPPSDLLLTTKNTFLVFVLKTSTRLRRGVRRVRVDSTLVTANSVVDRRGTSGTEGDITKSPGITGNLAHTMAREPTESGISNNYQGTHGH